MDTNKHESARDRLWFGTRNLEAAAVPTRTVSVKPFGFRQIWVITRIEQFRAQPDESKSHPALARIDRRFELLHLIGMKQEELRMLVRQSHQNPLRVWMSDGQCYTVADPDFATAAENALIIVSGPGRHDLGNAKFVICYFDQITRIEQLRAQPDDSKAA